MASEGASNEPVVSQPPTPTAPTPSNPMHELLTSRTHLANAFKHLLIAVHLPAIAGVLCLINLFSYWKAHVRLCDVTRYCEDLLTLPIFVSPLTLLFIFVALFTLDHYLSISPTFDRSKASVFAPRSNDDNDPATQPPATEESSRHVPNGDGGRERRTVRVLKTFTIISYVLSAFWAVSSLAAVTGAALILKYDAPFDPNEPSTANKDRVIIGFIAGVFDALFAFCMVMPAIATLRATRSVASIIAAREAEGVRRVSGSPVDTDELCWGGYSAPWNRRSTLDKAVLLPLVSLALSFVLGILAVVYGPFAHLRHMKDTTYVWMCIFNALFTWPIILVFHSYKSSGALPGVVVRAFISLLCIIVATTWLLVSGTYLFLSIGALFCDERAPLPYNSPCAYIRKSGSWIGLVACAFGYLQAYIFGTTATMSWESRGGIRLDTEDGV